MNYWSYVKLPPPPKKKQKRTYIPKKRLNPSPSLLTGAISHVLLIFKKIFAATFFKQFLRAILCVPGVAC